MQQLKQHYQLVLINGMECNIGLGAYGSVQLAKCLKNNQTVAIKKVSNQLGITEVKFHQNLKHQNIIRLIDYFYDEQASVIYIILQYAENGCLYDFIKKDGIQDKQLIKSIFKSTCSALDYMHRNGIMHRDVKNILLGKNNIIKLCDFGFAAFCQPRKTICGTPQYMAPEMILGKHYNHKVDIWGLGILLFELIEGHAPFEGSSKQLIIKQMQKPIYFSQKFVPQEIDLIHRILRVRHNERPQIKQIFQHSLFKTSINKKYQPSRQKYVQQVDPPVGDKGIKILQVKQISTINYQQNSKSKKFLLNKYNQIKNQETLASNQKSRIHIQKFQLLKNGKISLKRKISQNQISTSYCN